jgi:hypothetical protein
MRVARVAATLSKIHIRRMSRAKDKTICHTSQPLSEGLFWEVPHILPHILPDII